MTQLYAVKDNQEFNERSKFATDYVFVGNGAAALAEVARVKAKDGNQGVTIFKVTAELDFVEQADLDPRKEAQTFVEAGKAKATAFAKKWDIPQTKEGAKAKFAELKKQAAQEAAETGASIAGGLMAAFQMGQKDPKKLADMAKKGLKAKFEDVKARGKSFADGVLADAKGVDAEIRGDAKATVDRVISRAVGPEPMGVKTDDGKLFARSAWLTTEGNAITIKESTLKSHTRPAGPRRKPGLK